MTLAKAKLRREVQFVPKPTGVINTAAGQQWACWHVGITQYEFRAPAGTIWRNYNLTAYYAAPPDKQAIRTGNRPKAFRTFDGAAKALVKLTKS